MHLAALLAFVVPLAWLLPNHYPPWGSAYQEGLSLALVFAAALLLRGEHRLPRLWGLALGVALVSIAAQALSGQIHYRSDALLPALYLAAFALALMLGHALAQAPAAAAQGQAVPRLDAPEAWAVAVLAAAIYSVGIALSQWLGHTAIHFVVPVDLPPGGRPFANFAQANQFCSAAFLGLCSLALLRETGRVGRTGFWLGAAFLLLGMAASGSRTGWLQLALLLAGLGLLQRRAGLQLGLGSGAALAGLYALLVLAWPPLNEALLLNPGRELADQAQAGPRGENWLAILQGIAQRPWAGWGWMQTPALLEHVPATRYFEFSHNLVLELLVWAGLPLGALMLGLGAAALLQQLRALRCPRSTWLMLGALGLLLHAQLEYPLHYAYFLLPLGLMLGMAGGLQPLQRGWTLPPMARRSLAAGLALLLAGVALEYLKAEENFRVLRFEAAQFATGQPPSQPPDLLLLDQLREYLWFVRTPARADMPAAERERMATLARRMPHPPVLLRHALAAGLNGEPESAARALALVCRIHPAPRCTEAVESWTALQAQYPALRTVPAPSSRDTASDP